MKDNLHMAARMPGWRNRSLSHVYSNEMGAELDTIFMNADSSHKPLRLHIDYCTTGQAFHEIIVYCSYWLINLTDKDIRIKMRGEDAPGQCLPLRSPEAAASNHDVNEKDPSFGSYIRRRAASSSALLLTQTATSSPGRPTAAGSSNEHGSADAQEPVAPLMFDYNNTNVVFSNTISLTVGERF